MKRHILLGSKSLLLLSGVFFGLLLMRGQTLPAAQTPPAQKVDERHEVSVRLVLVDLIALGRDGRFAMDLGREDFEVFEDGKKMTLLSAELVRLGRPAQETVAETPVPERAPAAPPRESRFFVVVDSINTIARMLERSKKELIPKLLSLVELGQQVMVMELSDSAGMKVLQPLTQDKDLVAKAVETATGSFWVEHAADLLSVPAIVSRPDPGLFQAEIPSTAKRMEQSGQAAFEAENRRRFEKTINSLLGVMNMVKDFPGRKSVLLVSGGLPSLSFIRFFEGRGGAIEDTTAAQSQVAAAKILDPFKVLKRSGFRSSSEILEDVVQFANSHNISFYALDPDNYLRYVFGDMASENFPRALPSIRQLKAMGLEQSDGIEEIKKIELGRLQALAGDTGGESFLGGDRFEEFQQTIERDFTQYYELSYTPPRKTGDGKYHKIDVKVGRPGLDVRFRQGYLDYTDEQAESLLFASAAYNPALFKEIPFEAQVIPFVKAKDRYQLWIQTALPVRKVIDAEADPGKPVGLKFRVSLSEPDQTGGPASEMVIPLALPPTFLQRVRSAEYFGYSCATQETELKNERYQVAVTLYNPAVGQIGTVEQVLDVPRPEKTPASPVLATVLGNLQKTDKLMVIPFSIANDDGTLDVPGYKFYPLATPRLPRARRAAFLFQVSAPEKPANADVKATVLRAGQPLLVLPAGLVFEEWNKKAKVWNVIYDLGLEGLFPGDYELKFEWTGAAATVGAGAFEKTVAFKVF
jgi:VWFA-related protein